MAITTATMATTSQTFAQPSIESGSFTSMTGPTGFSRLQASVSSTQ